MKKNQDLFRGKQIDDKQWVEGYYVIYEPPLQCIKMGNQEEEEGKHLIFNTGFADWNMARPLQHFLVDVKSVGRYIGINDKNKKRIFTGDILDAPVECNQDRFGERQYYTVGVLDGQFILTVRYIPKLNLSLPEGFQFGYLCKILNFGENGYHDSDIEVIGNIYDNPELLRER